MASKETYDTIVVGAGLAGLSCAHELSKKGKKVLVLEAQDRKSTRLNSSHRG